MPTPPRPLLALAGASLLAFTGLACRSPSGSGGRAEPAAVPTSPSPVRQSAQVSEAPPPSELGAAPQSATLEEARRAVFPHGPSCALLEAAEGGDANELERLLAAGGDIDPQGLGGLTPLLWCLYTGDVAAVELLLGHGASPTVQDDLGESAPLVAARMQDPRLLEIILAHGGDPDARGAARVTPLIMATISSNLANVQALVAKGADINARDSLERAALHYAALSGSAEITGALLDAGADRYAPDAAGVTPTTLGLHSKEAPVRALFTLD